VTGFRVGAAAAALLLVGLPLALPVVFSLTEPDSWRAWREGDRLVALLDTTARLAGLVWLLAVPLGGVLGFLLFRSDVPLRRLWLAALVLALFVPLPLLASAWQAVFGSGGFLGEYRPAGWWGEPGLLAWTPWGQGLVAAAWIHALAALPWVVLLVGLGSRSVERELEEDALTLGPWPWVLWRVTLPRLGPWLLAASVWVVVQTATEITVTDLFQVRTFAEEVYTQMVAPEVGAGDAVRRATVACLPLLAGLAVVVALAARAALGRLPSRERFLREPLVVPLGGFRWPTAALLAAVVAVLLVVPVAALIARAGAPRGGDWEAAYLLGRLRLLWPGEARLLAVTFAVAATTGVLATGLALVLALAARGSALFATGVLALATVAWTMPAPLVGQGYRDLVDLVLAATGEPAFLRRWLYDGPSPVPLVVVDLVRFLPCALALVWPAVHAVPRGLLETARLDGLGPWGQLREVVLPLARPALWTSVLAVGLLTLGELGASKRASTPDVPSYAESLFAQMHFGIDADLAIRCLLLLAVVLPGALWLALQRPGGAGPIS